MLDRCGVNRRLGSPVRNNSFSAKESVLGTWGTAYTVDGTFAPDMTAKGNLAFRAVPIPGEGGCSGSASTVWTAKKQEKGKGVDE